MEEEKKKEEKKKEEKKQQPKKETATNKTKKQNIIIAVAVAIVIVLIIIACVIIIPTSPKGVVNETLQDLKLGNYSQEEMNNILGEDEFGEEAQKALFEKLEWKILKVTEEGDTANVEIEITNKDFKTIIGNYMQKVLKIAFSGEQPSQEEMTNYLMEELNKEDIQNVTTTQNILLNKQDGKWVISEENDFANILLPGFSEAMNSLGV